MSTDLHFPHKSVLSLRIKGDCTTSSRRSVSNEQPSHANTSHLLALSRPTCNSEKKTKPHLARRRTAVTKWAEAQGTGVLTRGSHCAERPSFESVEPRGPEAPVGWSCFGPYAHQLAADAALPQHWPPRRVSPLPARTRARLPEPAPRAGTRGQLGTAPGFPLPRAHLLLCVLTAAASGANVFVFFSKLGSARVSSRPINSNTPRAPAMHTTDF